MSKKVENKFPFLHEKKSEKAVLLFHGLTGSPIELLKLSNGLYEAGYDVYCPILPGHCQDYETMKKATWQDWINFSLNEFDKLKKEYNTLHLSGLCMGAVLAFAVAAERDNVASVIGLSTTLFLNGFEIPWFAVFLPIATRTLLKFLYVFPESGGSLGVKSKGARRLIEIEMKKTDHEILDGFPLMSIFQLLTLSKYVRPKLVKVKCPVLLIHSIEDNLTSIKSAQTVYDRVSSKHKEFLKLENSYHIITIDNDRDFVMQKSIEFFNRWSGGVV